MVSIMMKRQLDIFRLREVEELEKVVIGRLITCKSILSVLFVIILYTGF
jgi:hypothetical protein